MIDHVGLRVSDLGASVDFYRRCLAALGLEPVASGDGYAGFGPPGTACLWLHEHAGPRGTGCHIALAAPNRAGVVAFHAAGLAAGAQDNGPPGLRADYAPNYYAAFLVDRDGNNVEAVCLE
jgi:catechol 2,3-dioxygenase-like lactoylglutathione lyase family enzyme